MRGQGLIGLKLRGCRSVSDSLLVIDLGSRVIRVIRV